MQGKIGGLKSEVKILKDYKKRKKATRSTKNKTYGKGTWQKIHETNI